MAGPDSSVNGRTEQFPPLETGRDTVTSGILVWGDHSHNTHYFILFKHLIDDVPVSQPLDIDNITGPNLSSALKNRLFLFLVFKQEIKRLWMREIITVMLCGFIFMLKLCGL